jgi:hypothetical protein
VRRDDRAAQHTGIGAHPAVSGRHRGGRPRNSVASRNRGRPSRTGRQWFALEGAQTGPAMTDNAAPTIPGLARTPVTTTAAAAASRATAAPRAKRTNENSPSFRMTERRAVRTSTARHGCRSSPAISGPCRPERRSRSG